MVVVSFQRSSSGTAEMVEFQDPRSLPPLAVPGIATRRAAPVLSPELDSVASAIEAAGFWSADVARQTRPEGGDGWILEVRKGQKYKAVVRQSIRDEQLDPIVNRLFDLVHREGPRMR